MKSARYSLPSAFTWLLLGGLSLLLGSCTTTLKPAWFDEQEPWAMTHITSRETVSGVLDRRFSTADGMFAARELLLSGPLFFARFEELNLKASSSHETSLLNTAPWFARYNVEAALLESGLGVHLMHGPSLRDFYLRRAEQWQSPPDALTTRMEVIKRRVGLDEVPIDNLFPVYLPFDSGDPFYTQTPVVGDIEEQKKPDGSTLRWNEERFEKTFTGRTLGMTLLAEVAFANHYFRNTRRIDDGTVRPLLGATAEEGFLGALLLEMATSKIHAIATEFAYDPRTGDMGPMPLDGYDPKDGLFFVPCKIRPVFTNVTVLGERTLPPKVELFQPGQLNPKSRLIDQASLLYGLAEYVKASDPEGALARQGVFGPPDPGGPLFSLIEHGLAQAVSRLIYRNIVAMHLDRKIGTLVSYATPEKRGRIVHIEDAALTILALNSFLETLHPNDPMYDEALSLLETQSYFLLECQRFDGAYPRSVFVKTAFSTDPIVWPIQAHCLSIRSNLIAYRWLKDPEFTMAATRTYKYIIDTLWAIDFQLFRTEEVNHAGTKFSVYTPFLYGACLGALRDLAVATCDQQYADKLSEFIAGLPYSKLPLSELSPTEEQAFADPQAGPDPDKDGIPFAPRACLPFGAAPVFAAKTIVKIP